VLNDSSDTLILSTKEYRKREEKGKKRVYNKKNKKASLLSQKKEQKPDKTDEIAAGSF